MKNEQTDVLVQIPSYVFWKDLHSVYLGCNDKFAKIAGLNYPDEIVGKTDYDLSWGHTHAELYRDGDRRVLNGEHLINKKETQLLTGGQIITVLVNKSPLLDSSDQIIGIVGSYIEVASEGSTVKNQSENDVTFTNKQSQCLYLLAKGLSAKQIALEMEISQRTAEYHIDVLKDKLDCHSKSSLMKKAWTFDFIKTQLIG